MHEAMIPGFDSDDDDEDDEDDEDEDGIAEELGVDAEPAVKKAKLANGVAPLLDGAAEDEDEDEDDEDDSIDMEPVGEEKEVIICSLTAGGVRWSCTAEVDARSTSKFRSISSCPSARSPSSSSRARTAFTCLATLSSSTTPRTMTTTRQATIRTTTRAWTAKSSVCTTRTMRTRRCTTWAWPMLLCSRLARRTTTTKMRTKTTSWTRMPAGT